VLRLELERLTITRDDFMLAMKERNVGVSVHFIPLHLHPYYRQTFGTREEQFPQASRAFQRIVSLPIYSRMTDEDVADVVRAVREIVQRHRR
jgi:dTDP-4-amino-4,6-dideoxygalactose transaminase